MRGSITKRRSWTAPAPLHIALCRKVQGSFQLWPKKPSRTPSNKEEALKYLSDLEAKDFQELVDTTGFFAIICTR
ncbi:hypothetical protein N7495_003373 [Penicillium taxi]|uniref:uncharacterized protein n=1 Tax=Penicillium taxi TaxID=168475 RepID=UPI002545A7DA|nr:uncharacterized protein N7495_003373 [Penicillium taxi]KAJ5902845.1 hypothetical protein N7495_003373 [Penicillium taxi]